MKPGLTPDNFSCYYENSAGINSFIGVSDKAMAKAEIEKFIAQGYTLFNLCSAFNKDDADTYMSLGQGLKIKAAAFKADQLEIFKAITRTACGIILIDDGVDETVAQECSFNGYKTCLRYVKDFDAAVAAAKDLESAGCSFIELCSWFDEERTAALIEASQVSLPVGSCGF